MTISSLIERLKNYNPDLTVLVDLGWQEADKDFDFQIPIENVRLVEFENPENESEKLPFLCIELADN